MQMGGNLGEVFRRLTTAVNDIEKRVPFSHNDRLGFVSFSHFYSQKMISN
jgi:arginine kinase